MTIREVGHILIPALQLILPKKIAILLVHMGKALLNKERLPIRNMKARLRIDRDLLRQNSHNRKLTKPLHNHNRDHTDFTSRLGYGQLKIHSSSSNEAI